MSYDYQKEKAQVFTEDGQVMFLKIRDEMNRHCTESGAVGFFKATASVSGDGWAMIACIDRLIELGEFECIYDGGRTQDRIYRHL